MGPHRAIQERFLGEDTDTDLFELQTHKIIQTKQGRTMGRASWGFLVRIIACGEKEKTVGPPGG